MNESTVPVFAEAVRCLALSDPGEKCAAVGVLAEAVAAGRWQRDPDAPVPDVNAPGRPARPELVPPGQVPRRRLGSKAGRAALVHAIAHIEFNAINLALDASCRFRDLPDDYVTDWISVAADEARHFAMLADRLAALGHGYGDFSAHDGLWRMCVATADSCLERMALVPRVLEARGLDVTPGMIERLAAAGDEQTVTCLQVILDEEVRHVAIGTRWFHHCCAAEGLEPAPTFERLLAEHLPGAVRLPLNHDARRRSGFSDSERAMLERLAAGKA